MRMGEIVEQVIKERGMTKAEFGRRINTSRQNVNTLLRKDNFDTHLLTKMCRVLKYNFYQHLDLPAGLTQSDPETTPARKMYLVVEIPVGDHHLLSDILSHLG